MVVYHAQLENAGVPEAITYTVLFFASIVNGFTVGILWAASNQYVAECSSDDNKGFFFSYFWCFYMTSQILGNLIAAFTLGALSQEYYFIIMAIIASLATFSFIFLKNP